MSEIVPFPLAWSHHHRFRKYTRKLNRTKLEAVCNWLLDKKLHYRTMMLERIYVRYVRNRKARLATVPVPTITRLTYTLNARGATADVREVCWDNPLEVVLAIMFGDLLRHDLTLEHAILQNLQYVWHNKDIYTEVVFSARAAAAAITAIRGTATTTHITGGDTWTADRVASELEAVGWTRGRLVNES